MTRRIRTYQPAEKIKSYRPRPSVTRSESNTFTSSPRWRRLRAAILLDKPLCEDCEAKGTTTPATEVHHIQSRARRPDLALDPDNLKPLCRSCHSKRTARGE
ncbi:HNH endonuclease [Tautonia rosea]|uniref:HNH endonuclease n=1 Tax=Tautonia rosea TaxID=2728037 RepID=UPI00147658A8|nr:HNH endonuclease signature motif containing protein [Tautonia rosea]